MGPGGSLDAAFNLRASVPAGTYHVVLDSIVIQPVDIRYTLIWRRGATDTALAQWERHWDPMPPISSAQAYELDVQGTAIDFRSGDQLVFRYESLAGGQNNQHYIPNGDGALTNGRIPNITLPQ